jgi:hypothetical protein
MYTCTKMDTCAQISTRQMSMSALPEVLLHAVAAFMPPSDLLLMIKCSRLLDEVFGSEVACHHDGLFVVAPPNSELPRQIRQEVLRRFTRVINEPPSLHLVLSIY